MSQNKAELTKLLVQINRVAYKLREINMEYRDRVSREHSPALQDAYERVASLIKNTEAYLFEACMEFDDEFFEKY